MTLSQRTSDWKESLIWSVCHSKNPKKTKRRKEGGRDRERERERERES
jgi:hypothetical protein